ncbi:hypothetical protein C1701_25615 [Actinoalloteichus sp. AHMU CJ021]|uniref:hypothetical protein n=1 Tax=Actinoalloteichus sp. AHMU CJ021 TaxID=2072503 RepID=UPI000CA07B85|nr:hypothetical protein C1701_25615 [Actinoalloteichus sp. AHMU CJ021]
MDVPDRDREQLASWNTLALAQHLAQWRALKGGVAGIDTATDEILRWTTPSMQFGATLLPTP